MSLRDYQGECVSNITDSLERSKSALAVLPTGCGKTHCFSAVASQWPEEKGMILVLAHREELIWQAKEKIEFWLEQSPRPVRVGVEMGQHRSQKGSHGTLWGEQVVVASVASLHPKRLAEFNRDAFSLIIVDEAHHCVRKNASYNTILRYFDDCKILGVTATPDRSDEEALGSVFNEVAFAYDIQDAIGDGWLVPVMQEIVHVEDLDFSEIKLSAGDLSASALNDILSNETMCHKVCGPTIDIVGDKQTLVFASGVQQAFKMAEIFNRHKPGSAHAIVGSTDKEERKYLLKAYARGEFQFLCGCGVFTEGFDEPNIE